MTTIITKNFHHKKVLLVTLYGSFDRGDNNYGNTFQRCAMNFLLEQLGFEVDHLCRFNKLSLTMRVKNCIKNILQHLGVRKFTPPPFILRERTHSEWFRRFYAFSDRYIGKRIIVKSYGEVLSGNKERWEEYDFAVVGSDQVWHIWDHKDDTAKYYYLEFMPRDKRVNYAPSFGFSKFCELDYEYHKRGLLGFNMLSSREQEGCELIKQAVGVEAQLVLDPTLLLNSQQWRAYASEPEDKIPEHYVLCYFLGKITPEYASIIREIAGNAAIINLFNVQSPLDLPPYYMASPENFLYLVDHADFVCTDSFHGTAFSVNFGKNFLTFHRIRETGESSGMFGRISGLLSSLNIQGHIYEKGVKIKPDAVDYSAVNLKLDMLRESSMKYLRECLKVQN